MEDNKDILEKGSPNEEEVKTYTEEEVLKLIQSESDKRVSQALKTQKEKFEKKISEAEKLRNMDETQQTQYKLEQRIEELEELNRKYALAENKATLSKALAERNLPVQFVDYLVGDDAEEMMQNLTDFEKVWKAAVTDAVSTQLAKGAINLKSASTKQSGLTKEEFHKMSLAQQQELYNTNKELYDELNK